MEFEIRESVEGADVDAIIVGIPEGATSDPYFAAIANPLFESGDLPLKPLETIIVPGKPRTIFIGIAKAGDAEAWRRAAGTVVRRMRKLNSIAFAGGNVRAITEGALIGGFSLEAYKTTYTKQAVDRVVFVGGDARAIDQGTIIGGSINWARRLINEPSNRKAPRVLAERAREMASSVGLAVDVLEEDEIRTLKMGALLGVSQGSDEPPRVVVMKHMGNPGSSKILAYVGKGITFDTGGISLKA